MPNPTAKPDFLDADNDGNTEEPMKDALKEPEAQAFKDGKMREVMARRRG